MRKIQRLILFIISVLFVFDVNAFAEENKDTIIVNNKKKLAFNGYSGGMMFNIGHVQSQKYSLYNPNATHAQNLQLRGFTTGLGGALRLNFGKHLRVGGEGYVSNLHYGENDSYSKIGWGGLLVDYVLEFEKWTFFAGTLVGGGTYRNLTLLSETPIDYRIEENSTSFRKYSFLALDPFVGIEYALTDRVHLISKFDYMINISNRQSDFAEGTRFFIGFMFCH